MLSGNWEGKRTINNSVTAETQNCENAALFFGDGESTKSEIEIFLEGGGQAKEYHHSRM
jgi:hypothetical protein